MLAVVPRRANIGPSRNAGDWISGHRPYSGANALCVPRQKSFHDRDCIFAKSLDESIERLGLLVLKSPPRSPMANAICERAIGTIRRECLDWLIPISEAHLRAIVRDWKTHYNGWRPHMALGPGVPDPPAQAVRFQARKSRHRIRMIGYLRSTAVGQCNSSGFRRALQMRLRSGDEDVFNPPGRASRSRSPSAP
jgi:Integrase core domain